MKVLVSFEIKTISYCWKDPEKTKEMCENNIRKIQYGRHYVRGRLSWQIRTIFCYHSVKMTKNFLKLISVVNKLKIVSLKIKKTEERCENNI